MISKLLRCCFPCRRRRSHLPPLKTAIDFENLVLDIHECDESDRMSQYQPKHENIYDTLENATSDMATGFDGKFKRIVDVEISTFGTKEPLNKSQSNIRKKSCMKPTRPIPNECLHVITEEPTHYYWSPEERKID